MMQVVVLAGGPDAEHAISLQSAAAVATALAAAGHEVVNHVIGTEGSIDLESLQCDVFFPMLHGPWGEGGPLQRLLEADGRPFVGCPAAAAACCMDKAQVKTLARAHGLPTPDWTVMSCPGTPTLDPPLVVKPVDDGSSVGLYLCDETDAAEAAIGTLLQHRSTVMLERRIFGRELTVALLHGEALPIIEVCPSLGAYDYAAKYERDDTRYQANPQLDTPDEAACCSAAVKIAKLCQVRDLARVDFLLDGQGTPWLLEINTMPGFTQSSLFPMAANAAGIEMMTLCDGLIRAAAARKANSTQA